MRAGSVDSLAQTPKSAYGRQSHIAADMPSYKVIVVGDYAVGKSSLIRQLTTRQFSSQSAATIGVEFKEHRLADCILQLWDVAGQQFASSMTKQYYRFSAAAIVVADVSKESSFSVALDWRHDVIAKLGSSNVSPAMAVMNPSTSQRHMRSPDSSSSPPAVDGSSPDPYGRQLSASSDAEPTASIPIFLFANKGDLIGTSSAAEAFNTLEKIVAFARENGFYDVLLTSAKEYDVVVDAFKAVAQAAALNANTAGNQLSPVRATVQLSRAKRGSQKKGCCSQK